MTMRTRNWCVTSWTSPDYDSVERLVVSGEYKYVCIGKETCPRTSKVHWHWYLQAVNKKSMRQIKKDVGDRMAHAEAANGPADAGIAYVKKDGDWKEWGEPKVHNNFWYMRLMLFSFLDIDQICILSESTIVTYEVSKVCVRNLLHGSHCVVHTVVDDSLTVL